MSSSIDEGWYEELHPHVDHDIVCEQYGFGRALGVTITCKTCDKVLVGGESEPLPVSIQGALSSNKEILCRN